VATRSRGSGPDRKRVAAERAAETRRRIAEDQRRRRLITVAGAVVAVIVVVAVFVVVKVVGGSDSPKSGTPAVAAAAGVTTGLAGVPASVFDTIGRGDASAAPKPASGSPLTGNGKPRVLYVGAEWCPFCAAERWVIAVALERFGDFHGLQQVSSSPSDTYPDTSSLSFHGATYTSNYLAFTGKELQSNQVSGKSYRTLDTVTGGDRTLFEKAGASYPFVDLGGSFVVQGAQYDPKVLKGRTQSQIAAALSQPKTAVALGIIGSANLVTASLCTLTDGAPAAVCSSAGVKAAAAALPSR
jgi:thiol-disulfide isomerase/thioredoxin